MADERHRGGAINTALLHHQRQDRRQPDVGGPDRQQRAKAEQQADDRVAAVLRVEELHRHEAHELAIVIGDALSRPDRLAPFGDGGEPVRFDHAPADHREQQRRHDADEEHHAPAVAADQSIGPGTEERAERAACHHDSGDLGAMRLAQRLGEQWNADHEFRAGAEAGDETVEGEIPDSVRQALQRREDAIDHDAGGQCAHAADIVGVDAEDRIRRTPSRASPSC